MKNRYILKTVSFKKLNIKVIYLYKYMQNNEIFYEQKLKYQSNDESFITSQRLNEIERENIESTITDRTQFNEENRNSNYINMINKSKKYNDKSIDNIFDKFKDFAFKMELKINLIDAYIKKFVFVIYSKLKNKIEEQKEKNNNEVIGDNRNQNNSKNQKTINDKYSFKSLEKNLNDSKKDISSFFSIFDYVKLKLTNITNIDYILFITRFLKLIEEKERLDAWKFINYIYMIKIFNDINEKNDDNKKKIIIIINYQF